VAAELRTRLNSSRAMKNACADGSRARIGAKWGRIEESKR
jgi:hypothetical protein